jgi:hypothetical protein
LLLLLLTLTLLLLLLLPLTQVLLLLLLNDCRSLVDPTQMLAFVHMLCLFAANLAARQICRAHDLCLLAF